MNLFCLLFNLFPSVTARHRIKTKVVRKVRSTQKNQVIGENILQFHQNKD